MRTLAFHPDDPQTFYVGIEVGSLLKTTDGGQTFAEAPDCGHDIHRALVLEDPARTVLVTTGLDTNAYKRTGYEGLFRSTDGGVHYAQSNSGLGVYKYCEDAICAEPGRPQRVYLATARGIPPYWASMTRMVLGAAFGTFAYFVTPSRLRRRSGAEVVLFASDDGGASWQRLETQGLPTPLFDMVWALDVAPDPGRPAAVPGHHRRRSVRRRTGRAVLAQGPVRPADHHATARAGGLSTAGMEHARHPSRWSPAAPTASAGPSR